MLLRLLLVFLSVFASYADAASSASIETVDSYLNTGMVHLPRVEHDRIADQQCIWDAEFDRVQFNQKLAYAGIVVIGLAVIGAILYQLFAQRQNISNEAGPLPVAADMAARDAYIRQLHDRETFSGRLRWIAGYTFDSVICSALAMVCIRIVDGSWDGLASLFNKFTGSAEDDCFVQAITDVLHDIQQLGRSLQSIVQMIDSEQTDDSLFVSLRMHMVRNVIVNNVAFVKSCEKCMAAFIQFAEHADLTAEQRTDITQSARALTLLINRILEREETALQEICLAHDASVARGILTILHGLYDEIGSMGQIVGAALYGKNFMLQETA